MNVLMKINRPFYETCLFFAFYMLACVMEPIIFGRRYRFFTQQIHKSYLLATFSTKTWPELNDASQQAKYL